MRIAQIEQIIEIAKTGSINKAAGKLYISQPSLSASLKSLEAELEVALFYRTKKGMVLTPEGQRFLYFAEPIYQQYNLLSSLFEDFRNKDKIVVRIANAYLKSGSKAFVNTVSHFPNEPYRYQYREMAPYEVIEHVAQQLSDIGLIFFSDLQDKRMHQYFQIHNLEYIRIKRAHLNVVCGEHNPLYHSESTTVSSKAIQAFPLINYQSGSQGSELIEQDLLKAVSCSRMVVVNSRATMHELLHKTDAIKIGFEDGFADEVPPQGSHGLRRIQLDSPGFDMEIGLVMRENYHCYETEQYYIDTIKALLS